MADTLDVPTHVLRFWESRFAQVKPVKRGGGRRYYRPEDVRLLRGIRGLLYDEGMTIKGVQKILRERGLRHVIVLGTLPGGEPEPRRPSTEGPSPEFDEIQDGFEDGPENDPAEGHGPVDGHDLAEGPFPLDAPASPEAPVPAEEAVMAETPIAPPQSADAPQACAPHVPDRQALRALIAELEALRAVMVSDGS